VHRLFLIVVEQCGANKERGLTRENFHFYLAELAKLVFPQHRSPKERLFSALLTEQAVALKDTVRRVRTPINDDTCRRILAESAVAQLSIFEEEAAACYIAYVAENYRSHKLLLSWKELGLQKVRLSIRQFVTFLKEAEIVPNMISIEHIEEICTKTLPPIVPKEFDFYQKHGIVAIYERMPECTTCKLFIVLKKATRRVTPSNTSWTSASTSSS